VATADVIIKIDVRDGEAKRKLTALEARLNRLNKAGGNAGGSIGDLGDELDRATDSTDKFNKEIDKSDRSTRKSGRSNASLTKQLRSMSNTFSPLIKFAKYAGIEFGVMAIAMVGLKIALVAGQAVAKAWQFTLQALGASAGLAIGALAGVLAAVRELNNAKLKPLAISAGATAGGPKGFGAEVSGLAGSAQLGMFKQQTMMGMAKSQYNAGDRVTADYRAMAGTLGNFAIAADDPDKALAGLTQTFVQAQKEGKFTEDMIKSISESSPQLGKALKETGMNAEQFFSAFSKGEIESLKPFQGALDEVNNTLIGRFKTGLRGAQEQLTEMGAGLTDTAKGPLSTFTRQLTIFLSKISPTIKAVMSDLIPEDSMSSTQRFFDYLARSINVNLPKIFQWGRSLKDTFSGVGNIFGNIGDWLEKATGGFNNLYDNILEPLGSEVWKTIEYAIMSFSKTMENTGNYGEKFSETIHNIGEGVRAFIDGLATLKEALAPIVSAFMTMIGLLGKMASMLGPLKPLLALLALGALTGRSNVMGANGKSKKMGITGGMLNVASMGAYSQHRRGKMPIAEQQRLRELDEKKRLQREARKERFLGPARDAKARATYKASQEMQYTRAGMSTGGYAQTSMYGMARGNRLTDEQVARVANTQGHKAGAKVFAKTLLKEGRSSLKGPAAGAGLSMAGMLAGGLVQGNTSKTSGTTQALGGALAGAGMGASIGTMIAPGIGTAIGAGLGAVVGGVGGFLGAKSAADEQKKESKERGKAFAYADLDMNDPRAIKERVGALRMLGGVDDMQNRTNEAFRDIKNYQIARGAGDKNKIYFPEVSEEGKTEVALKDIEDILNGTNGLVKEIDPGAIQRLNAYKDALMAQKTAIDAFGDKPLEGIEAAAAEADKLDAAAGTAGDNIDYLSKWLGKSKDGAKKFADELGLNLSDRMLGLTDVIKLLGYQVDATGDKTILMANKSQAAGRILDMVLKPIEERAKKAETLDRLNAAGQQLFNYTGGDASAAQKYADDFLSVTMEKLTQEYATNEADFPTFLADATKRYEDTLAIVTPTMGAAALEAFKLSYAEALVALTSGAASVQGRMALDPAFAIDTATQIQTIAGYVQSDSIDVATAAGSLQTFLEQKGMKVDAKEAAKLIQDEMLSAGGQLASALANTPLTVQGKIDIMLNTDGEVTSTTATFNGTTGGPVSGTFRARSATAGEIAAAAESGVTIQDTSTPRAGRVGDTSSGRWGRTLGKHMAFNSMLSGNRTITSGLRNTNLGSGMSDHRFGNAYDLTGDNLGQYSSLVNASGGFSEFHGSAGSRHLHVVPPSGDSASPASVGGMGGSTVNNYNISVQGGSGANANEIAQKVVTIIKQTQRSDRERA
jgi:hypothetical protein